MTICQRLVAPLVATTIAWTAFSAVAFASDAAALQEIFDKEIVVSIDADLAKVAAELEDPATPASDRPKLAADQKRLKRQKLRMEDSLMVQGLVNAFASTMAAVRELGVEAAGGCCPGGMEVHPFHAAMWGVMGKRQKIAALAGLETTGKVLSAVAWMHKAVELKRDLDGMASLNLSPAANKLARNLTVTLGLMSSMGEYVPFLGAYIKGYGSVGNELLKQINLIDKRITESEGGQLTDGVHGSRKDLLLKLRDIPPKTYQDAYKVLGLKSVYLTNPNTSQNDIIIWDASTKNWVVAKDVDPSITLDTIKRRYTYYANRGVKSPTPQQILRDYRRVVALRLTSSKLVIVPGETVSLTVTGTMVHNGQSSSAHRVQVSLLEHTGYGDGEFVSSQEVKLGQSVSWTAPDNSNETYTFGADFIAESRQVVTSAGEAKTRVYTGRATNTTLSASTTKVVPGAPVTLSAVVTDAEGTPLSARATGTIDFAADGGQGSFLEHQVMRDRKGETRVWYAPDAPGRYTIRAAYEGENFARDSSGHVAASAGQITIEVANPLYSIEVDKATATATAAAPARFSVTVRNGDSAALTLALRRRSLRSQRPYWRLSSTNKPKVTIPAGQALTFSVELVPVDLAEATTHKVIIIAAVGGSRTGKQVLLTATNAAAPASCDPLSNPHGCHGQPVCDAAVYKTCTDAAVARLVKDRASCYWQHKENSCPWQTCIFELGLKMFGEKRQCAIDSKCSREPNETKAHEQMKKKVACFRRDPVKCSGCAAVGDSDAVYPHSNGGCNQEPLAECLEWSEDKFSEAQSSCPAQPKDSCPFRTCATKMANILFDRRKECHRKYACDLPATDKAAADKTTRTLACLSGHPDCATCFADEATEPKAKEPPPPPAVDPPAKTPRSLIGPWQFGRKGGGHLCTLDLTHPWGAHGHVINSCHGNESFWDRSGDTITFKDSAGNVTTRFKKINDNYWEGPFVLDPSITHYLRR